MPTAIPSLALHQRYGRSEVYAALGTVFSQRNRTLIRGLAPRGPDGGYCIFVTLDKQSLGEPSFDYEDDLFADRLVWVTRRGASEDQPDYVSLRTPGTRVSLFVRNRDREQFAYLGELDYVSHTQYGAASSTQQRYVFALQNRVPEDLLLELTAGVDRPAPIPAPTPPVSITRRPRTLGALKSAFSYALTRTDREVNPAHYNYQVRLKEYLASRGVDALWEEGNVDVRFTLDGRTFIGEIKTTNYLTPEEAFRIAVGQVLFYSWLKFDQRPACIVLFDCPIPTSWVGLATELGIGVVVEEEVGRQNLEPRHRAGPCPRPEVVLAAGEGRNPASR